MNFAAVAHMPDQRYCYCTKPGRFIVRLQTGRGDLSGVILHYQDKYIPVKFMDTRKKVSMNLVARDAWHDYYEAEISIDVVCLRYFFELCDTNGCVCYYSSFRFLNEPPTDIDRMYDLPQNLREVQRFQTPEWAKNKVVYQIFPSRFATTKDIPEKLWYKAPIKADTDLQGNLRGIIEHLDHIRELGVDIVYMTPIFHSKSTHKYDTIDYYAIDPTFGTTEDLIELVEKAHGMGMRVVLDGVFNHTAPEFFAFSDLENNWEHSPYRGWYYCDGKPKRPLIRFKKPNYKCFSYHGGMPKLNMDNPETGDYFIEVARYWMKTAHIDGWRLDVGDEVSHQYWRRFRQALKQEFPDALIVGEVWHYAADFLQGDTWDSVMNYPFLNAVVDFVANGEITATDFVNELGFLRGNLNTACYPLLWNLIGSHDTPRALHRCNGDKRKLRLMAAMQLLLPGMPFLYYGDEVGMTGGADPDCRRGMLWDKNRADMELFSFYRRLIALRKQYPELTEQPPMKVETDDENGIVIMEFENFVLIFHGGETPCQINGYIGCKDLIGNCTFNGEIASYQSLLIQK